MTVQVIVVDDEPLARQRLRRLIDDIDGFAVVAEAATGEQLGELIAHTAASIVILDIHLPGLNGLQLAAQLAAAPIPPAIIFCTAFEQHALAAFDYHAVDYILKPARPERLAAALARAAAVHAVPPSVLPANIVLSHGDALHRLAWSDLRAFVAADKYVAVLTVSGRYLSNSSLVQLEQQYPTALIRIHRNALVVPEHIIGLVRTEQTYSLQLADIDQPLAVSRRHLPALRRQLKDNQHRLP